MGSNGTEGVQRANNSSDVKAQGLVCWELRKILDIIGVILPEIESARPGFMFGIKELCSLNNTIGKTKLLIQHCAESSMLYLSITAEATLLRCERTRTALDQSLCQIQDMVPQVLAAKISDAVRYLREVKFVIDTTEEEAGKAMLELLRQSDTNEELEFKAFQTAALRLNITSPKALLIERRSIQKLLDKVRGSDPKKERILGYFLYLLKKYGKKVKPDGSEQKENTSPQDTVLSMDSKSNNSMLESKEPTEHGHVGQRQAKLSSSNVPPEEFCCPISSRVMYDPVVIDSGQTYERTCIEKWFSEGHDTCPKTQKKLESRSMIPNTCMKDIISHWCIKHGLDIQDQCLQPNFTLSHSWEASHSSSITSLKNVPATLLYGNTGDHLLQNDHSNASFISFDAGYISDSQHFKDRESSEDRRAHMFPWSDDYQHRLSFSNFSHDMFMKFLFELSELPLELQGKAVDDFNIILEDEDETFYAMLSKGFIGALLNFLENTKDQSNVQTQKLGAQILLSFQSKIRVEIPEDAFQLLISFIDSDIMTEALMIVQKLTCHPNFISYIEASGVPPSLAKILDSEDNEHLELAVNILYNLSSHTETKFHISSSGCLSKLVPLLSERNLLELCLKIIRNLCDCEVAVKVIAGTDECLASIAEVLETGTLIEQEHAVVILCTFCSYGPEYCQLVLKEGVIPSLVDISVNGNSNGKESSMKLLHLLRDVRHSDRADSVEPQSRPTSNPTEDVIDLPTKSEPTSKSSGFFGRKMRFFSKTKPLALF